MNSIHRPAGRARLSILCAALAVSACTPERSGPVQTATFAPALQVNLQEMTERPSGLYIKDVAPGSGSPAIVGDSVRIEYSIYLADGKRIDGVDPGQPPFEFRLGQHEVIAGWEEGVLGMREGGRRRLVVPPDLGLGLGTHGSIPGGSVLVVDLHLLYVGRRAMDVR